jgi:hypothetical protein
MLRAFDTTGLSQLRQPPSKDLPCRSKGLNIHASCNRDGAFS